MNTIIGIVSAVISGVILRFLFELLLDEYIRPNRQYREIRGKTISYLRQYNVPQLLSKSKYNEKGNSVPVYIQNPDEAIRQLTNIVLDFDVLNETIRHFVPGVPKDYHLARIINSLWILRDCIISISYYPFDYDEIIIELRKDARETILSLYELLNIKGTMPTGPELSIIHDRRKKIDALNIKYKAMNKVSEIKQQLESENYSNKEYDQGENAEQPNKEETTL